ncbi:MAG: Kazal-type serine protease inhibitor, partial [Candidatus Micrarchaeota archaeon]
MRGMFGLMLVGLLLLAGCAQQAPPENATNATNVTPPVEECDGPVCGSDGTTYPTDCDAEVAGVSILYEGACVVVENCTETDSGIDAAVAGSVARGNETKDDYCLDGNQLVEYTCLDNAIDMATIQCGDGKECKEGRCAPIPPPQNMTEPGCAGPSETDLFVKGTVKYNGTEYSDSCVEYGIVKEWFCKDDKAEFT